MKRPVFIANLFHPPQTKEIYVDPNRDEIAFSCNYFYGNATNFRKDLDSLSIVDWLSETEKIPLNLDNITLSNIPHPQ